MNDLRPRVVQIEMHASHACPLHCQSCTHFSQEGFTGRATVDSFRDELLPWAKRLLPHHFLILGGEPTLNPELTEICEVSRAAWPEIGKEGKPVVNMMIVTTGFFLHRHPRLPEVLKRLRIHLDVSRHHDSPEYLAKLEEVKAWAAKHDVPVRWRESFRDWKLYYTGVGQSARPFDDKKPDKSWRNCDSRWCMQIHEGKLWKCPPITYLSMHVERFGDGDGTWQPYLKYKPIASDCTDAELQTFVDRKAEDCCRMCPADPKPLVKSDPLLRLNLERVKK